MLEFNPLPVLSSLVVGELARLRRLSTLDPVFLDLKANAEIGGGALGVDSLELLTLAGAVSEMFHLHETGVEEYLLRYRTIESWSEIVSASLKKKAERITFRTSGSTGAPKRCVHDLGRLVEETVEHSRTLPGRRVLSMVPSHHIYGFIWTVLLPAQLDVPRIDVRHWSPSRIARDLRQGDVVVGVPANWRLLSSVLDLFPSGVFGITSGAPCPPDLFEQVRSAGVDLLEVYGSTETAGIGTRRGPTDPFSLLPLWVGAEAKEIHAPDELQWDTDRLFRVGPRRDGAVQVAGNNVFPARVEEVIRSYPAVESCAVRLMLPAEGNRLKVFVVWRENSPAAECSEDVLRKWVNEKLQTFERPASYSFGASLPVNDMYKSADWPIESCAQALSST